MSRQMLEWSMRLRMLRARFDQLTRGYSAEVPNNRAEVSRNTADAHLAGTPCANTMRMIPAATAMGKVPACIQPRQLGLRSRVVRIAKDSSSNGRLWMQYPTLMLRSDSGSHRDGEGARVYPAAPARLAFAVVPHSNGLVEQREAWDAIADAHALSVGPFHPRQFVIVGARENP